MRQAVYLAQQGIAIVDFAELDPLALEAVGWICAEHAGQGKWNVEDGRWEPAGR